MPYSDVPRILASLKAILRARRLTYADLARDLGVHEATVKRHLNGGILPIETLERICRLADIRLADLIENASASEESDRPAVTAEQERALVANRFRAFLFYLLQCGWPLRRIRSEFQLGEEEMTGHLAILSQVGLIRLKPGNRVEVRVARRPAWRAHGAARTAIDGWASEQFSPKLLSSLERYEVETVKITAETARLLRQMMSQVADSAGEMAAQDLRQPPGRLEWHALLMAIRPVDPSAIPDQES